MKNQTEKRRIFENAKKLVIHNNSTTTTTTIAITTTIITITTSLFIAMYFGYMHCNSLIGCF